MRKLYITAKITLFYALLLSLIYIIYGCGSGDVDELGAPDWYYPETQNIIFYGTREMTLEITSDAPNPAFAWQAIGMKYVVITIFESKIDLKDNQVANTEDAVWTWNTGMGRGREGNVSFSDGRDVKYGEIQDTVTLLSPGTYFLAAWSYDSKYRLTHSSEEYKYKFIP